MFCREPPQGLSWPRSGRVVCSSTTQSAPCRSGFLAYLGIRDEKRVLCKPKGFVKQSYVSVYSLSKCKNSIHEFTFYGRT